MKWRPSVAPPTPPHISRRSSHLFASSLLQTSSFVRVVTVRRLVSAALRVLLGETCWATSPSHLHPT